MFVPRQESTEQLEIKKSLFIATAAPLENTAEAKVRVARVRALHPKANHVVWVYAVGGETSQAFGMSDDGEPRGTAGSPALKVLQHSGFTNILVTVVRYFGGIKLGRGGLVRAYTESVQAALAGVSPRRLVEKVRLRLTFDYPFYEGVRTLLAGYNAGIETETFETRISLVCAVEDRLVKDLTADLLNRTNGKIDLESPDA